MNFAKIAYPLTQLTHKGVAFKWMSECQQAFDTLRIKLIKAPIMSSPTDNDSFVLDVDASDFGIGGVLSQVQGGIEKVISYASRTLNKS